MNNSVLLTLSLCLITSLSQVASAQETWLTRTGNISLHAGTALEDIDAVNNEVGSVIDPGRKEMAMTVLIRSFRFRRALMEQHFNENYMESSRFPRATFRGNWREDTQDILRKDGTYKINIEGVMTIHGVSRTLLIPAILIKKGNQLEGKATLQIKPEDYGIKIPGVVREKIAQVVTITIDCQYSPRPAS